MSQTRHTRNAPFLRCIEALKIELLPEQESDRVLQLFTDLYPMTEWGKIDWDKINHKMNLGTNYTMIIDSLKRFLGDDFDPSVFIEWGSAAIPAIKTNIYDVIQQYDYVVSVTFDKFIFNPSEGYIIEILPGDDITVGVIDLKIEA